ncbi:MAG: iron-containing alcohol dehydrogenase [Clostridiales bacterium]|nr:iron-containing alcohol dehydrogenase [Clostridiales bacterium]
MIVGSFYLPTRISMGKDCMPDILSGKSRVFIVTDRFMHETGRVSYITDKINEGASYEVFSEVTPDPDITQISKGVEKMLAFEPDLLVALGGGSPIDAAKAIMYFAAREKDFSALSFVVIPTTSGTGSEVSRFAVITDSEKGIKYPLVDDKLLPDTAVLDPSLVASLPPAVTADTGIDVLTHAVEAFVSNSRTDFSDAMAEKSIKLVYRYLLKAYKEPENLDYRQRMHNASCLAGAAFSNAGLGINHSLAHALGGKFHIPHGRANGILLPYVMSFNAGCTDKLTPTANRYAKISRLLDLETTSVRQSALNLIRTARRFIEALGMPSNIKDAGISQAEFEAALPEMAETALKDSCTSTNPEYVRLEDLIGIYQAAWSGKWW